jgi:hypothetical protein
MASLLTSGSGGTKKVADPNMTLSSALARVQSVGEDSQYADTGNESFIEQAKHKGLGLAVTALDFLNRPSQAILKGIQAQQTGTNISDAVKAGITGKGDPINLRAAMNTDNFQVGKGYVNKDAEKAAAKEGGLGLGAIDTIGTIALDPTSFIGAGAVKTAGLVGAKAGVKVLAEEGADELAQKVAANAGKKKLSKVLTEQEQAQLRDAIMRTEQAQLAKQSAEKFADKAMKALDDPSGIKVLGKTVIGLDAIRPATEAVGLAAKLDDTGNIVRRGLGEVIGDTRPAQALSRAFNNGTDTARVLGSSADEQAKELARTTQSHASNMVSDIARQINVLTKAGKITNDEVQEFEQAIQDNTADLLVNSFKASGDTNRAALVDLMSEKQQWARTILNAKTDAQAAEAAAKEAATKEAATDAAKSKATQGIGVSKIRQALQQVNQEIERYSPKLGSGNYVGRLADATARKKELERSLKTALSESRAATQKAISTKNTAAKAVVTPDTREIVTLTRDGRKQIAVQPGALSRALGVTDAEVRQILNNGRLPEGITTQEFETAAKAALKTKKDIVEKNALKTTVRLVQDAAEQEAKDQLITGLGKIFADDGSPLLSQTPLPGYDLVKTITGEGYIPSELKRDFSRLQAVVTNDRTISGFNHFIDEWNKLWRAYATVPLTGLFGFHLRNAYGNMFNNLLAGVVNPGVYKDAFRLQNYIRKANQSSDDFMTALRSQEGITPRDIRIIEEARSSGTIGNFLVQADQEIDPLLRETSRRGRAWQNIDPTSRQSLIIRSGAAVGQAIEQNARLAHFIDQIDKHGDVQAAAASVRKYLFDYSDLTPFEQNVLRRVVPFYTYMRKNTALQVSQIAQKPGVYSGLGKIQNEASLQGPDTGDKSIPQYALKAGMVPIIGGKNPLLASMANPFQAAADTLQPAANVLGLVGGKRNPLRPEGGAKEAASSVVQQFGGAPVELAKFGVETATGKDLFTGADVKTDDASTLNRLAQALSPAYTKTGGLIKAGTSGDSNEIRAKLIAGLSGLSTMNLTDKRSDGEVYRRTAVVQDAINQLKASGTEVPTITELRKAGVVPPAPKKARTTKIKKGKKPKVGRISTSKSKVKTTKVKRPGQL